MLQSKSFNQLKESVSFCTRLIYIWIKEKDMIQIPENIAELKSYKPGKPLEQIIKELQLKEVAVLWNNENNFGPSPKAMNHVTTSLSNSHYYPDPVCTELRNLLATKWNRKFEEVAVGNGSESIFNNLFNAFFENGAELLTCSGTFVAVYIWAKANNVKVQTVPLAEGFGFDLVALYNAINDKTKAIYLSNPNNPTGSMISEKDLVAFIQKVPSDILIIVDEAYYEFAHDLSSEFPNSASYDYENVLTLRTFSKAYGIAAIRIGYAIGHEKLIEAIMKVKLTFEPSNLAQAAGIGALSDTEYLKNTIENNSTEIKKYYQAFEDLKLDYTLSFGNFVMVNFKNEETVHFYFEELMKLGVFVRPLKAFGLPHCLRITVGIPRENEMCIEALTAITNKQ